MTAGSVLLWCLGVLAALTALCWVVGFFQRKLPSEKFDERQQQVRGRANSLALTVGMLYYLVLFCLMGNGISLPLKASTMVILGVLIQLVVLNVFCLLGNANLPLGQNPEAAILSYACTGFVQLWIFRNRMEYLKIVELALSQGVDPLGIPLEEAREDVYLFLIFSVMFFSMAALHLIRALWPEKEE